jgi:putative hydrolase of the HAD superfamily
MSIRAVIFDFGGVLCFSPTLDQFAHAASMAGVPVADFDRAVWANRLEYDAGRLSPEAYWQEVAELSGSSLPHPAAALSHLDLDWWRRFDDRVLAWAQLLRRQGFATAILSNLPRPLGEALRRRPGFLEHFDHHTFSYELGLVKPQREIYTHCLAGLGVAGSQALFLDDRAVNIEGALDAGLQAELYPGWEEFLAGDPAARYGLPAPEGLAATPPDSPLPDPAAAARRQ